ncbi:MAG: energy-coupling factor transporter transmembrane component T, partial [Chloroflexota bacterium]|nr:energy-coupling factor transporter transmembrane component T [Chloroflexota bacterium]
MTTAAAVILGGVFWTVLIVVGLVLVPAALARVLRQLLRFAVLFSLPIAISALLVNVFFYPGGQSVIFRLGPITATAEGLSFAIEILCRIAAISGAVTLFYLTTKPSELVLDLERRGVPARLAFVANASVQTVPAMAERAQAIIAAQRARGLDTEGSALKRIRGIVPIVGPVMLGSISEVEERSMTLEARAFTRPGRRDLLWSPPDASWQRLARWLLVLGLILVVSAKAAG